MITFTSFETINGSLCLFDTWQTFQPEIQDSPQPVLDSVFPVDFLPLNCFSLPLISFTLHSDKPQNLNGGPRHFPLSESLIHHRVSSSGFGNVAMWFWASDKKIIILRDSYFSGAKWKE